MDLKGRLKLIAEKVPECDLMCDVGTDHAYIPIYTVSKNISKKAIASDVRKGPIAIAEENIKGVGLQDRIEVRLGSGLKTLAEGEADTIVIAGMGGVLIRDILEDDFKKACSAKTLILQPMNAIEALREWLCLNGFEITDEELVSEGEKIYNVIVSRWTGNRIEEPDIFYYIGRKLIEKPDPLLRVLLNKRLGQIGKICEEMRNTREDKDDILRRYSDLASDYEKILKSLS